MRIWCVIAIVGDEACFCSFADVGQIAARTVASVAQMSAPPPIPSGVDVYDCNSIECRNAPEFKT